MLVLSGSAERGSGVKLIKMGKNLRQVDDVRLTESVDCRRGKGWSANVVVVKRVPILHFY